MKIAIISDIHGNIYALKNVLKDIELENCQKIFCLGDLAMAGPEPSKTLSKIKELSDSKDFYIIQGNTDKMLSVFSIDTKNAIQKTNEIMSNAYENDSKILTNEEKNFLANLPPQKEIELFGVKILLVHGSPRKNDENIYPNLKIEEVEEMIKFVSADIIFCGHTHVPCGYQTNTNQTVVNAGSVGRPFSESPQACYAILEINEKDSTFKIKHKFVKYDVEKAAEKLRQRNFEGSEKLAQMLIKAVSRYPE